MKLFTVLALTLPIAVESSRLFGVSRGGKAKSKTVPSPTISKDDYVVAERELFKAIMTLEGKMQHVIEEEVDNLFHDHEPHEKRAIIDRANKAVKKGVNKVTQQVDDHDHDKERSLPLLDYMTHYPYSWPEDDPGHQILHSIESAEKSVVHAVNDEVKNFFHGPSKHHDDHDEVQKAHKVLERGLKKTTKHLDEAHEHRREWFKDGNLIEEYNQLNFL